MRCLFLVLAFAATFPAFAAPQRCAHITAGVVDNVVIADPAAGLPGVDCSNPAAQVGWTFAGGVYTPVAPAVVYQTSGLSFLQFMALFTTAEQVAVIGANDVQTKIFIAMATGAPQIDLTDARVAAGVNYLASINLITPDRAATILTGAPPH